MARLTKNYSNDKKSVENNNANDKYDITGESEFSRESTIPFDEDEVLSERHYNFSNPVGRVRIRSREIKDKDSDHQGTGPMGYKKTDEKIKDEVSEALYRSSEIDASLVEVFVNQGEVILRGSVKERSQKQAANSAVEHIIGVHDVFNEITIVEFDRPKTNQEGLIQNRTGMN